MTYNPPDKPNCADQEPEIFENEWLYNVALGYCRDCPVQKWCLDWVDPAKHFFDGVAGGHVWKDGVIVRSYTDPENDAVLMTYLKANKKARTKFVDTKKVQDFLVGKNPSYRVLTLTERVHAVLLMSKQDYPANLAAKLTQLPVEQVIDVYQNPAKYELESKA